jgi:hypothetical protein
MAREYRVPPAWQEGGAWGWRAELERQARVIGCKASNPLYDRFVATARQLTMWRIRSPVQASPAAIEHVLPLLEATRERPDRRLFGIRAPWSDAELGALIVECRNRLTLAALGRDRARVRGPRMDPTRIPLDRLEHLIQRHADLELVERLRAERNVRISSRSACLDRSL